jgi:hypothetical protein
MSIEVTASNAPINVSASGVKVEANVTGGQGPQGPAATITVGTVTTGAPGSSVSVTNSGTSGLAVLNFTIPAGADGATGPQGPAGPAGGSLSGTYPNPGIAAGAVGTSQLSDGSVTDAKIVNVAASKLTGTIATARLGSGTANSSTYLRGDGTWAAAAGGSAGTKTILVFSASDNQPPATSFATFDTRNSILVLEFDAAVQESAIFVGVVPEGTSLTAGLTARLWWMGDTETSGNVRWGVSFEKVGTDNDADSFDTVTQAHSAASGTSGIETVTSITATSIDSLAAGDRFRLRVTRIADDATNDTMAGDAQLVAVELQVA